MPRRVRPVGVPRRRPASSMPPMGAPTSSKTRVATCDLSLTTLMLGARPLSSSAKRFTAQPVATTSGAWGRAAIRLRSLRVLASASAVTAQLFTTTASASALGESSQPSARSVSAMSSSSSRFTLQPRLTKATLGALTDASYHGIRASWHQRCPRRQPGTPKRARPSSHRRSRGWHRAAFS